MISSDIIKQISPSSFEPMKYIINIFPDYLKIAKGAPLVKKDDHALMDDRALITALYQYFLKNL